MTEPTQSTTEQDDPAAYASAVKSPENKSPRQISTGRVSTDSRVAEISSLLMALEEVTSGIASSEPVKKSKPQVRRTHENKLAQVRLGMASSLYSALLFKHRRTAEHSLRVALGCSTWALAAELDEEATDTVELAALLHDVGKIGVSDSILNKPGRLTVEEDNLLEQHCEMGTEIVACCCGSQRVLDAIQYSGVWFDGQNSELPLSGSSIPLEARMIAIVDAFDFMTTDQVHRSAWSRDRAIKQLFEAADTQFDRQLVKQFVEVISQQQDALFNRVASRWLTELAIEGPNLPWQSPQGGGAKPTSVSTTGKLSNSSIFEQKLIDSMHDGVVFVDSQKKITLWNKASEKLTGISRGAATGRLFEPSLLELSNDGRHQIPDDSCPLEKALQTNSQIRQRLYVLGRKGDFVPIDLHAIPVFGSEGMLQGATILMHDAQPEATLEERCEALHAEVTRDPLTKVANRAEFDRMLTLFIDAHLEARQPCSLVMVDIDYFKKINDTFGHQAGDEAIITLANLLSSMCRSGDLVARYGGEEFAVLCADCSNSDGARRAEEIRAKIGATSHNYLGNQRITASFGVTELQEGDSPETMLRRADRALLMAKELGRNQVIQLGNGMEKHEEKKKWWQFKSFRARTVLETSLSTPVPIDLAIEKLKGFVSDHQAKIISTCENSVELEVSSEKVSHDRRQGDRHILFRIEIELSEDRQQRTNSAGLAAGEYLQTRLVVKIRPKRKLKRRNADCAERARLILGSIKAYLMARDASEEKEKVMVIGTS